MNSELFNRLKKLAKREGKIIFADDKDIFVILPLDEYEIMTDSFGSDDEECGECDDENCTCGHEHDFDHDSDFGEEIFMDDKKSEKPEEDETDKDLIKRVNEDIAKWREEQAAIKPEKPADMAPENKKDDVLTEEERYYLEPLE
jgi:hypothetical protein